ncbi:MAG: hypothetical protein EYC70_10465 [Planctomycetota bacterium]|nr:MAG: hypothetical protein EYC70_10465 [Planctomycetota bacterium]
MPGDPIRRELARLRRPALAAAVIGLAACAAGFFLDRQLLLRSYLLAFLFWTGLSLGSLGLLMVQHLSGGRWGFAIQRPLEAAAKVLPLCALLFLPILLGQAEIYEWAHEDVVAGDPVLELRVGRYLNTPFFVARAVLYFLVWCGLALLLAGKSRARDEGAASAVKWLKGVSGPGLVLLGLSITFASIDWSMSTEPHWFSTMYGLHYMAGYGLSALLLMVLVMARLRHWEPASRVAQPPLFHDLGTLSFALTMVWAYFSFSQYLIVWSGNLPEETPWYARRAQGGWEALAAALLLLHFVVPFFLLLSRRLKRSAVVLARVALCLLALRVLDLYWVLAPAFHPAGPSPHWLDLATLLGLGGLWLLVFYRNLGAAPLLAREDPRAAQLESQAHPA